MSGRYFSSARSLANFDPDGQARALLDERANGGRLSLSLFTQARCQSGKTAGRQPLQRSNFFHALSGWARRSAMA